ncbi:MAG: OadG family protein [Paludibacter sp.]|jgi:sodium pump decarboxylase gamma subunit|nr:OadG family protein [Paludibacter sp.]
MNLLRINQFSDILVESGFGILVVFVALALLVLAFYAFGKISRYQFKKNKTKANQAKNIQPATTDEQDDEIPALEVAAIATALTLFFSDVHDEESNVITIKRIERRYSPWNSKIYGITNLHR